MNKEILMVIETVANEKTVSKDIIVDAIEHALAGAVKKKYRLEEKIDIEARVSIDLQTGDYTTLEDGKLLMRLKKTKITLRFLFQAKLQKIIILMLKIGTKNKLNQLNSVEYWHKLLKT